MKIGLYQAASPKGNIDAGLNVIETALSEAASNDVDMLVMQELFLPGYGAVPKTEPTDWSSTVAKVAALSKKYAIALTIGLPEYENASIYNSAFVFSETGEEIARYRKMQLFGPREADLFERGERHVTFDYKETRFGLLICYDVEFPEHVRALARKEVQVVLVPTANMEPYVNVNNILVPARAAENGISIIYANYCGSENDLDYVGLSTICRPDGYSLAKLNDETGLIFADLSNEPQKDEIPWSTQLQDFVK